MRYAQIRNMDISNGEHLGVSLFVQGCRFQCVNCFNQETWDFNGGKEWTEEVENKLFELANKPYIKRISILGGEPLANENAIDVLNFVVKFKRKFPDKTIWLYTGYTWEQIFHPRNMKDFNPYREKIIYFCDVLVDGKYIDKLRDLSLKFCGSNNQRVINVQKSLKENKVVLYN